jgi:acetylcholinesterase
MRVSPFLKQAGQGHYLKEPFSGTVFLSPLVNYTNDVIRQNYKYNYSGSRASPETFKRVENRMFELYPDNPALGSPFGTGNQTFGLSPGFKRASAMSMTLLSPYYIIKF